MDKKQLKKRNVEVFMSDEDYAAWQEGDLVFNNGIRKADGALRNNTIEIGKYKPNCDSESDCDCDCDCDCDSDCDCDCDSDCDCNCDCKCGLRGIGNLKNCKCLNKIKNMDAKCKKPLLLSTFIFLIGLVLLIFIKENDK